MDGQISMSPRIAVGGILGSWRVPGKVGWGGPTVSDRYEDGMGPSILASHTLGAMIEDLPNSPARNAVIWKEACGVWASTEHLESQVAQNTEPLNLRSSPKSKESKPKAVYYLLSR